MMTHQANHWKKTRQQVNISIFSKRKRKCFWTQKIHWLKAKVSEDRNYPVHFSIKISLSVLQDKLLKIKESQKDIVVSLILPKTTKFLSWFLPLIKTIKAQYYTNEDLLYITKYIFLFYPFYTHRAEIRKKNVCFFW